jgi:hypothetical protein
MASANLKAECAKRLIGEMIEKVAGFKVMCVDRTAMKVISSCLKMSDITDMGVAVVENVALQREPLPDMECIYFTEPSMESWIKIRDDFKDTRKPQYRKAHLFFTSKVPDSLFQQIKQSPNLLARVGNFVELNMEFLCIESQVFSLDMQGSFSQVGPTMLCPGSLPIDQQQAERNTVLSMATRLMTFCSSIGEFPNIRYQRGDTCATKVADALKQLMEAQLSAGASPGHPSSGSSTVLILDRSHDPLAPLLNEFYVQGCATDMLKLEGNTFSHNGKKVLLTEEDEVWRDMCHVFVGAAQETVDARKAGLEQRPAFKMLQAQKTGAQIDIKGMSDVVKDLPKFKKEYDRVLVCVDVLMKMMDSAAKLIPAVEVQQALACERINKERQEEFRNLLNDAAGGAPLSSINKLRLIMLYTITQFSKAKAMPDELRTSLMQMAGLTTKDYDDAVKAAQLLGRDLADNLFFAARKASKAKPPADELSLARYVPLVKDVAQALLNGELDSSAYPFMREASVPPASATKKAGAGGKGKSARRGAGGGSAPRWASKSRGAAAAPVDEKAPKVVIFIVGGMTHSEMRCVYEASKGQKELPVLLGSTSLLHPSVSYDASGAKMGGIMLGCPEFVRNLMDVWHTGK